jgi:hypothetical protein
MHIPTQHLLLLTFPFFKLNNQFFFYFFLSSGRPIPDLIKKGKAADYFVLILEGRVEVTVGKD